MIAALLCAASIQAAPDSALIERARRSPDSVRIELQRLLAGATADSSTTSLSAARRVADAYAAAWRDSFFVERVRYFAGLSREQRRAKVRGDSLRVAGNEALNRQGVTAAMRLWRESHRTLSRIGDSAGIASALGNIGVGFLRREELDSAATYLTRSRDLAQRVGDHRTATNALGLLGDVARTRGELREARELFFRAESGRALTGDKRGLAADRNQLGLIAQDFGDLAGARRHFDEARALNTELGRRDMAATNLVNIGNVLSLEADYDGALSHYRQALATYRDEGNEPDVGFVLHSIGALAMRRGDYPAAIASITEAASIYRRTGPPVEEIAARQDLFQALAAIGNLDRARSQLQRAESLAALEPDRSGELLARLAVSRGDLELYFNRLPAAERQYERAIELSRGVEGADTRAKARQGLAMVLLVRENYAGAQEALQLVLRAEEASDDRRSAALTRLLVGFVARQRGDTTLARRTLQRALDSLVTMGDVVGEAAAIGAMADLQLQLGMRLAAESLYHRALTKLAGRSAPDVAWRLHHGVARASSARGDLAGAAAALQRAVEQIERVSATLTVEERRSAYLSDKWEVYADLALAEHRRGNAALAFASSERMRARQMLDLLSRGRIVLAAGDQLAGQEQDGRRRIAELTRELETGAVDDSQLRGVDAGRGQRGVTLEALAEAQQSYGELLLRIREKHPAYASVVQAETIRLADVQRALEPGDVLLEYLVAESTTVLFVVTRDSATSLDLNVTHEALAAMVDFARSTLSRPTKAAATEWRAPMLKLYRHLVLPATERGLLTGKRRLLIAPHGELHYLPFAALLRNDAADGALLHQYVIEYVPSASVWLKLRERPARIGSAKVLAFAPRPDRLPGSRAEVATLQQLHGERARVLVGAAATEQAFRTLARDYDIVHLATFGVLNKHNPLFSFVELAGGAGQDGRLEAHEVFGLELNARLLVLSACQTGIGAGSLADVPPGDDWVGLVRTFLFAGASNVVATLWPVEDRSTSEFMAAFHRRFAESSSPGTALIETQRIVALNARTAHPFYWAGFVLVRGN